MSTAAPPVARGALAEVGKIGAFLRRDFLIAWSYRVDFFRDILSLVVQVGMFYFIGRLVDPAKLPQFGGEKTTYLEFVALGIVLGAFVTVTLRQVAATLREEQLQGTLEVLLLTPTRALTVQFGSLAYDLLYIPIRMGLFLLAIGVAFGLTFHAGGILPAATVVLALIPFVWGLGIIGAAGVILYRRGEGGVAFLALLMTVSSGAYFPLSVLPGWLQGVAAANPFAVALHTMRSAMLGGSGWSGVPHALAVLLPAALVSVVIGHWLYERAMRRELRRGTLGDY